MNVITKGQTRRTLLGAEAASDCSVVCLRTITYRYVKYEHDTLSVALTFYQYMYLAWCVNVCFKR